MGIGPNGILYKILIIYLFIFGYTSCNDRIVSTCKFNFLLLSCMHGETLRIMGGNFTKSFEDKQQCDTRKLYCTIPIILSEKATSLMDYITSCDNKQTCNIRAEWTLIKDCGYSDYMTIHYRCSPKEKPTPPPTPTKKPTKPPDKPTTQKHETPSTPKPKEDDDNFGEWAALLVTAIIVFVVVVICLVICIVPSLKKKFIDDNSKAKRLWDALFNYDVNNTTQQRRQMKGTVNLGHNINSVKNPSRKGHLSQISSVKRPNELRGATIVRTPRQATILASMAPHPNEGIYDEINDEEIKENEYERLRHLKSSKIYDNNINEDYTKLEHVINK